jgi:suppressor for copper-sensitivity B
LIRIILIVFAILSYLQPVSSSDAWSAFPHSKVRIISTNQENVLAAEFKIDKDWYIYGADPGDLGVPTTIKPAGNNIYITNYHWPIPTSRVEFDGSISYIYQDDITIPFAVSDNRMGEFEVSYVICGTSCIPVKEIIKYDHIAGSNLNINGVLPISLGMILLIAFCGGVILNFMPCVLPILSIKLMSIISNSSDSTADVRKNFIASSLGIIFSFLSIAAIISIFASLGRQVGFGMHFQEPIFIITMVIITLVFGSNLRGDFEINLPSSFYNFSLFSKNNNKLTSSFFSGMFACVLATPCSAPFVGTAVGFALSQGALITILIFGIMGVGFALPYIILAIFPKSIGFIPKSGGWMMTTKSILGYLLYLTTIWLLFILSAQLTVFASILLFGLALLLKFFLEKKHISLVLIIAALCYYIPMKQFNNESNYQYYVDDIWHNFEPEKIPDLIKEGKVVVVDITANWCATCKINKFLVLDRVDVLSYLKHHKLYAMRADITKNNPKVLTYMKGFNRHGIPFNVVYGENLKQPIVLSELLTKQSLIDAIMSAGGLEIDNSYQSK